MEHDYEKMVSDLLNWLNSKIVELGRPFQKSMMAVQREMATFKHFRTVEKPPKYVDYSRLSVLTDPSVRKTPNCMEWASL